MEIYRGRRLSVEKQVIRLPDGRTKEKVIVNPGDAVAMLPVDGDDCLLIRQYRFAIGEYLYEAPAGTMEPGEKPLDTAKRELVEEIGHAGGTFIPRGTIFTTPGFTTERLHLFEVRDLAPSDDGQKDEDEIIDVVRIPTAEVAAMAADGRICDAKTICLVYRCLG